MYRIIFFYFSLQFNRIIKGNKQMNSTFFDDIYISLKTSIHCTHHSHFFNDSISFTLQKTMKKITQNQRT